MSASSSSTRTSTTHLPLFLDISSLDSLNPPSPPPPLALLSLYSLHRTLPTPLTLHSYLHAILFHLTHVASTSQSFTPSSITTSLHHFTHHLSACLLRSSPLLSSLLTPLVDVLPFSRVVREGPVLIEWVDDFTVAYVAGIVSHALRFTATAQSTTAKFAVAPPHGLPSSVKASPTVTPSPALSSAVGEWFSAVQKVSFFPCTPTRDCAAQLVLTLRLLLAPLHALRLSQSEDSALVGCGEWQSGVCGAIADALLDSASSTSTASGEMTWTCLSAFQHSAHTVAAQWLFHLCTPAPLLPLASPFPSSSAPAALLATLSKAVSPHELLAVLADLIVMLFHHTSAFRLSTRPLPLCPRPLTQQSQPEWR